MAGRDGTGGAWHVKTDAQSGAENDVGGECGERRLARNGCAAGTRSDSALAPLRGAPGCPIHIPAPAAPAAIWRPKRQRRLVAERGARRGSECEPREKALTLSPAGLCV